MNVPTPEAIEAAELRALRGQIVPSGRYTAELSAAEVAVASLALGRELAVKPVRAPRAAAAASPKPYRHRVPRLSDKAHYNLERRWDAAILRAATFPGSWADDLAWALVCDGSLGYRTMEDLKRAWGIES